MLGGPQIPATLVVGGSIVENQSIKKELQKRLASSGALFSTLSQVLSTILGNFILK